jgi:TENA/THI-4/PQQC family
MFCQSAHVVLHIEREMSLHLDYCQQFGLSRPDIEKHKESQGESAHLAPSSLADAAKHVLHIADMFSMSGNPRIGLLSRWRWRHVCWDMAQLPKIYIKVPKV